MKASTGFFLILMALVSPPTLSFADGKEPFRHGDLVYFSGDGNVLHRYDLRQADWLSSIPLSGEPTAMAVDEDGIYLAYGKTLVRRRPDGGGEAVLHEFASPVASLETDQALLFALVESGGWFDLHSMQKSTGTPIDSVFAPGHFGLDVAKGTNKIYLANHNLGGTDMRSFGYVETGEIFEPKFSVGTRSNVGLTERAWVMPDQQYLLDDDGMLFNAVESEYVGDIGHAMKDVAFRGNWQPVLLKAHEVVGLTAGYVVTGSIPISVPAEEIQIHAGEIFLFAPDAMAAKGLSVTTHPLSSLSLPPLNRPLAIDEAVFVADDVLVDRNGIVYLYAKALKTLFRWDPGRYRWLESLYTGYKFEQLSYHAGTHTLFGTHLSGWVMRYDLGETNPQAEAFAKVEGTPSGILAMDENIFVHYMGIQYNNPYRVFRISDGKLLGPDHFSGPPRAVDYLWDAKRRRLVLLNEEGSHGEVESWKVKENGEFTDKRSTSASQVVIRSPLRMSPDQSVYITGRGGMLDASDLNETAFLPGLLRDAAWLGDGLFTLWNFFEHEPVGGPFKTKIQKWDETLVHTVKERTLIGKPVALLALSDELQVFTSLEGRQWIHVFDGDLNLLYASGLEHGLREGISARYGDDTVELHWAADAFRGGDRLEVQAFDFEEQEWRSREVVPVADETLELSVAPGSEPLYFRLRTKERVLPTEPVGDILQEHSLRVNWTEPEQETTFDLYLGDRESDQWNFVTEVGGRSYNGTVGENGYVIEGLDSHAHTDVELRHIKKVGNPIPEEAFTQTFTFRFQWDVRTQTEDGYVLGYRPINEPVVKEYVFSADTLSATFSPGELERPVNHYELFAFVDGEWQRHPFDLFVDMELSWEDPEPEEPLQYHVEQTFGGTGPWYLMETLPATARSFAFTSFRWDFANAYRIFRVEKEVATVYDEGLQTEVLSVVRRMSRSWDEPPRILQWRRSPAAAWEDHPRTYSQYSLPSSDEFIYEADRVYDFRMVNGWKYGPRELGFLQLLPERDIPSRGAGLPTLKVKGVGVGNCRLSLQTSPGLLYELQESRNGVDWATLEGGIHGSGAREERRVGLPDASEVFFRALVR
ncbi:MAG: hypothetical protein GVY10_03480 [Verrucomicrobia bacterium]|jgi:hypothetical protein|nr:hypothetical protein [Verrucomicrobiota bacterium]